MNKLLTRILLLLFLGWMAAPVQAQTFDLRMIRDSIGSGYLYARVQIRAADTTFRLGTTDLFFDYDPAVLDAPEVVSTFNYVGYMSTNPCLSGFCVYYPNLQEDNTMGRSGMGVNLAFPNAGADVPLTYTDVFQLRFPILNPQGNVNVVWRSTTCKGEVLAPTVVKLDDDETTVCEGDMYGLWGRPDPGCKKDSYEPNDELYLSSNLFGGAISGLGNMRICPRYDEDWHYFTVSIPKATIKIQLSSLPANYNLELHNLNGLVASSAQTGTQNELITLPNAPQGTYYVRVYGFEGAWDANDDYQLAVSVLTPVPPGGVGVKPAITAQIFKSDPQPYLKVYPNPAVDAVNAEFLSDIEGNATLVMVDAFGRLLIKQPWQLNRGVNSVMLDIAGLTEGVYFIRLDYSEGSWEEKVLVVHD